MEKEFLTKVNRSYTLNVTAGKIDSFREQEETTTTVRVYRDGFVGIAGGFGKQDEELLTAKAVDALKNQIPYPCELGDELVLTDNRQKEIVPLSKFIPTMQDFLDKLGKECEKFAFSNKIQMSYKSAEYRNSRGRQLSCNGSKIDVELVVQNRGSGNLYDTFFGFEGADFDADYLVEKFKEQYDAYFVRADVENGRYPIVTTPYGLVGTFLKDFVAETYGSGASLISGKLGQKVFSDKLTMRCDMNQDTTPMACFFDTEGCVAPNFRPTLVENGVLKGVLTTKKSAQRFNLPVLGTAAATYDSTPTLGFSRLYLEPTAKTLSELVPDKAIYVVLASGGDSTPDGHFATPVQMAYLMENGKLVGRLPEINVGGNFFDLFGKDYLGAVLGDPQKDSLSCAVVADVAKA